MNAAVDTPKAGWRMKVAIFALAVSIFTVLWFAIAALGTKFGLWPWQVGLGQMTIGIGPGIAHRGVQHATESGSVDPRFNQLLDMKYQLTIDHRTINLTINLANGN